MSYFKNFKSSDLILKLLIINKKNFPNKISSQNVIKLSNSKFIYALPKVIKIIKKDQFDVVLSTFPNISAILLALKHFRIINCKILIRQPNEINMSLRGELKLIFLKYIYKYFIKFANAVIVTSLFMRDEALKNNVKPNKIFILRNPIDVKETRKKIKPIKQFNNKVNLIFVGRLVFQKGVDRVLKFFANNSNLGLTIIGDGNQKQKLLKIANNLGVLEKVIFLGQKIRPYSYIAGADYFILPSRWEGLPNCVLESLALGTPVLTTKDVHSLIDFKKNIADKSIIIFKDIEELGKKIKKLNKRKDYRKPKLRKSLLINYTSNNSYNRELNKIMLNLV